MAVMLVYAYKLHVKVWCQIFKRFLKKSLMLIKAVFI